MTAMASDFVYLTLTHNIQRRLFNNHKLIACLQYQMSFSLFFWHNLRMVHIKKTDKNKAVCHFHFPWQRPINALINFYDLIRSCLLYYQGTCQPSKEKEWECIDWLVIVNENIRKALIYTNNITVSVEVLYTSLFEFLQAKLDGIIDYALVLLIEMLPCYRWAWCTTAGQWSLPSLGIRTSHVKRLVMASWFRWRKVTAPTSSWSGATWWAAGNTPPSPASWSSPCRGGVHHGGTIAL